MTAAIISSIVTLLIAGGTGLGWLIRRRDAHADPLPRSAAEVAIAKEALGVVQASASALREDVERLREDREADQRRIDALEQSDGVKGKELNRLRGQVRRLAGALSHEVIVILDWIDGGAKPPPPKREAAIVRDLIRDIDNDMQD